MSGGARYDEIGVGYARFRRPDPRIESAIHGALGRARTVLNVGAGTGSYEPVDRTVVALEPSSAMIDQRPGGAAPCVRGDAATLPFGDRSFDAAMALLTVHHWSRSRQGLSELGRVAEGVVIFTFDPVVSDAFWLFRDYVPVATELPSNAGPVPLEEIAEIIEADRIDTVMVPHDCVDGFGSAHWRRPERYLDPEVRGAISSFALLAPESVTPGIERLRSDLATGRWHRRNAHLLDQDEFDAGLRLVIRNAR